MSLKGNLETFPLPSILQLLHNDSKTGVFQVNRDTEEFKIYFYKGIIIYAMGSRKEDRLGNLLLKRGLISKAKLNECLTGAKEKKQALGKYLVEKKHISVEILKQLIQKQTENIIYNLFLWEKSDFDYKDAKLKMDGIVNIKINVIKVILEASRRIDEMEIFKKQIPSDKIILKVSNNIEEKGKINFTPAELQMLKFVNGKRSAREIFRESEFDGFSAHDEFFAYKTLHSLISSGMVEIIEPVQRGSVLLTGKKDGYNVIEIITVYIDILQSAYRHVESELGKQTLIIFIECKSELSTQQWDLLKDFYPGNPIAKSIHAITQTLDDSMDSDKVENFIINCFNKYFSTIIEKISSILGGKFYDKMYSEIDKIFSFINENKRKSSKIKQIKNRIEQILNQK